MGFKIYCSNPEVEAFLNGLPHLSAKRIWFPLKDKRKLREVFDEHEIQFVINLAKFRGRDTVDEDYVQRRQAVDFGLPLINEARCAELFVDALERKITRGELTGTYEEGRIPSEVRSWSDFIGHKA